MISRSISGLLAALLIVPVFVLANTDLNEMVQEGNTLWQQGDFAAAEKKYQQVILKKPKHVEAHIKLGGLYLAQQRNEEAIIAFQSAVSLEPKNPKLFTVLGVTYMHAGKYGLARAASEEALKLDPELESAKELVTLIDRKLSGTTKQVH